MPINRSKYQYNTSSSAGRLAAGLSNRQSDLNGICLFNAPMFLMCLALILAGGCGKTKAGMSPGAKSKAETLSVKKSEDKRVDLPGAVRGTGWHIPWYASDPKHPDAPTQRLLVADAKQGAMDSDKDIARIRLTDVQATLYHEGKPSATLVAPHVTTNERDRVIVATGGVTIHSLIDPMAVNKPKSKPTDTTVTADKVVWNSHTTEVVCTGNAVLIYKQADVPDITQRSDVILYDTATQRFRARNKQQ